MSPRYGNGKPTLVQTPIQRVKELRGEPTVIAAQQMPESGMTAAIFPDVGAEGIAIWPQNGTILLHQLTYYQTRPYYSL